MTAPLKLAILETDVLRPALKPTYHSYGRMFTSLLNRVEFDGVIKVFEVIDGHYPDAIDDFDAFLITGSKHDAFSDDDWIVQLRTYCQAVFQAAKPMIGICFGHQLLAQALGGQAGRSGRGWGLGIMEYQINEDSDKSLPSFVDSPRPVTLLISHQDQVLRLPPGASTLLSNDFCPFAAYHIPDRVLCFQGHPEFDKPYQQTLLAYRKSDISAAHMQAVESSLALEHQGERIARWMCDFLDKNHHQQAG
jgi:GMP synthase (glutamine-hydrolysing)